QGSRGFYIRAERASLPSHASDMLSARLQAIGGTRTSTSQDSQLCRLLTPPPSVSERDRVDFRGSASGSIRARLSEPLGGRACRAESSNAKTSQSPYAGSQSPWQAG